MFLEFKVNNFLSLKEEQVLSFEASADSTLENFFIVNKGKKRLLKMALLYGANASGKTNIIAALDFLRGVVLNRSKDKASGTAFVPFLLDEKTKNDYGVFDLSFFIDDTLHLYHLELNDRFINKEELYYYPGVKRALIFSRNHNHEKEIAELDFGSTLKLKPSDKTLIQGNTIKNISVIAAFSKLNIEFPETGIINEKLIPPFIPMAKFSILKPFGPAKIICGELCISSSLIEGNVSKESCENKNPG